MHFASSTCYQGIDTGCAPTCPPVCAMLQTTSPQPADGAATVFTGATYTNKPQLASQHTDIRLTSCMVPCTVLVPSGSEGFFGEGDPNVDKNPQPWAKQTGQNFVDDNRHMDFAVTHAWPDNCELHCPRARQVGCPEWPAHVNCQQG